MPVEPAAVFTRSTKGLHLFAEVVHQHQVDAQLLADAFQAVVANFGDLVAKLGQRIVVGKSDGDGRGVHEGLVVPEHDRLVADQHFVFRRPDLDQPDGRLAGRPDGFDGLFRSVRTGRQVGVLGGQLHRESHAGRHTTFAAIGLGQQLEDL